MHIYYQQNNETEDNRFNLDFFPNSQAHILYSDLSSGSH